MTNKYDVVYRKLQATVDCFRENFDSRGFLQVKKLGFD